MDLDVTSSGEGSGTLTTTSSAVQIKRVRHKWTSAFRVMQSLHRLKNPPLGAKSEVCFFTSESCIKVKR